MTTDDSLPNTVASEASGEPVEPDDGAVTHAPVPDPAADLTDLAVFAGDDDTPAVDAMHAGSAAYDDEIDLAAVAPEPDTSTAFTPFGGSFPPAVPSPAYDIERDTGA